MPPLYPPEYLPAIPTLEISALGLITLTSSCQFAFIDQIYILIEGNGVARRLYPNCRLPIFLVNIGGYPGLR